MGIFRIAHHLLCLGYNWLLKFSKQPLVQIFLNPLMITNNLRLELLGNLAVIKVNQVAHSIADDDVVSADILLNDSYMITFFHALNRTWASVISYQNKLILKCPSKSIQKLCYVCTFCNLGSRYSKDYLHQCARGHGWGPYSY